MSTIHPTAIIEPGAQLGAGCTVGAYCVVGSNVVLGEGCVLHNHVSISGHTTAGAQNVFFPFSSIGSAPQDKKYAQEPTRLIIGTKNTFRENVTVNTGTVQDAGVTQIGNENLFMALSHVGHDCVIGNQNVFANGATLAGHVRVGNGVTIGGLSAVHQFVRIGCHAMIGGMSGVERDVPPYMLAMGNRASLRGLNMVGLKRLGVEKSTIRALKSTYDALVTKNGLSSDEKLSTPEQLNEINLIKQFIKADSKRGVLLHHATESA